jgi:hypothetical protein
MFQVDEEKLNRVRRAHERLMEKYGPYQQVRLMPELQELLNAVDALLKG